MLSGKYRVFMSFILTFLLSANLVFSGTTGKIAGKVIDKDTGEPLYGVNIIVVGTNLGAATDIDGYFVILNVQPGMQSIRATMIGYAGITVSEVRVRIDETSPVNFEMVSQAIEAGTVVVVAERSIIKQDVSTSVSALQPEEIQSLPITSITDVVGLQAGVEEGLKIRGGGSDALLFQLDGVSLRDPRDNKPITAVALSSVQEISIERGGFNAEYGQVRSGIINIVTREGSTSSYYGAIQTKYSPATPKHFGMSVYDPNSMWNRPFLDPEVCWTGTENGAWDLYTQRQYPRFEGWNSISQALLADDDPTNDLSPSAAQKVWEWTRRRRPTVAPDYNVDASFGGPVPFVSKALGNLRFFASMRYEREMLLIPLSRPDFIEYNGSVKINSDISDNTKLTLNATLGKSYNVVMNADDAQFNNSIFGLNGVQFWNPTDYLRTPLQIAQITAETRASRIFTDSWYSQAEVGHVSLSGKLTQFISSNTFFEISFEHVNTNYLTGPIRNRDLTKSYEIAPGYFVDEAPFGFDINPYTGLGETGFFFGGHSATIRDSSKFQSYIVKANLVTQVTKEHMIKAGIDFSYFDLKLDYGLINDFFDNINYVKDRKKPFRFAAYVQDKIEMFGFIANIGVRMDLSNPNTSWPDVDAFDKSYYSASYDPNKVYPLTKSKVDVAFSPRLGISHPITENSKLYFNYGHFKQMPAYQEIFRMGRAGNNTLLNIGDPNLIQAKTVSYELGYDHSLFDQYLLQIAAFYNDVSNQQAFTQYQGYRIGYFQANSNSYQDVRGLEVTLKKTEGNWIRGFANFTYQIQTQGQFGKQQIFDDPSQQKQADQNTPNLYQQKPVPQPRANLSLIFLSPIDFGPEFFGFQPLANWNMNLLGEWRAGEYLTYNPNNSRAVINNVQVTDYFNFDLQISKTFDLKPFQITLLVDVRNLLDTKKLSGASFYDIYDQQYYFESLHLPANGGYTNIVGEDRVGTYKKEGVKFQPIEQSGNVLNLPNPNPAVIYYDRPTQKYMNYVDGNWSEVDGGKMQQILDDKAYIDMPNNSSFDFLNPRQVFFGVNISFTL